MKTTTTNSGPLTLKGTFRDIAAGIAVYFVALPLCLGIALASDAPLAAGIVAGIVGGIVVGMLSGSHTSVSGPAAGLTAVVAALIIQLGSFQAFLVAVVLAGVIQIGLGLARAGFIASFFPSSVIKGLLAGIGVILILKQVPHVLGHDTDPEGEMGFSQPDGENSFTELVATAFDIQPGAAMIGIGSLALLVAWSRSKRLSESPIPGAVVVVLFGVLANAAFGALNSPLVVSGSHLVQVPVIESMAGATKLLAFPDWSILSNSAVYVGALTLALVASLETLLNLDAIDQLDPQQRQSPSNRELIAQGIGNVLVGMIGGLPMTSVVVRGSVNVNANNSTKFSTILHGLMLLGSVLLIPSLINTIPLAALAAILLVTGFKLASPKLLAQMWREGRQQFLPFIVTVSAIVLTDLLTGVLLGLGVALMFILWSNFRSPLQIVNEHHLDGDVLRIELANQVSFLNRASLDRALRQVERGGHVLLDARNTDYVDPDILDLIHDFRTKIAPSHGVDVSLVGFRDAYAQLGDQINFADYSTRELQSAITPDKVVELLQQGNQRFRDGKRLTRNFQRQVEATAPGQAPLAVVVSCIDSRAPAEHVFDLGLGDIFSVRIAGNVTREKVLGSIEYSCQVAGAKLVVVMGHTACGAVTSTVKLMLEGKGPEATGCDNIGVLVDEIAKSIGTIEDPPDLEDTAAVSALVDQMARRHVLRTMDVIRERSGTLNDLLKSGQIDLVGAMYDVHTGEVEFLRDAEHSLAAAQ